MTVIVALKYYIIKDIAKSVGYGFRAAILFVPSFWQLTRVDSIG